MCTEIQKHDKNWAHEFRQNLLISIEIPKKISYKIFSICMHTDIRKSVWYLNYKNKCNFSTVQMNSLIFL